MAVESIFHEMFDVSTYWTESVAGFIVEWLLLHYSTSLLDRQPRPWWPPDKTLEDALSLGEAVSSKQ
jgi:hypothetical protein